MCFTNEAEWSASVHDENIVKAGRVYRCGECRLPIQDGEYYREIEQQEHEACYDCDEEGIDCKCDKPNIGETFHTRRCLCCDQFLQAIMAAELEEGCSIYEALPPYESLFEELQYVDNRERYVAKAREMFPIVATNGYLEFVDGRFKE